MKRIEKKTKSRFLEKKIKLILRKDKDNLDRIREKNMCRFYYFLHPVTKILKNPSALIFPNPIEPIPYPLPPPLPPQF